MFSDSENIKKSAGDLQSTVEPPPVGPGQNPGGGLRGQALENSAYFAFGYVLLIIVQFTNYIVYWGYFLPLYMFF